MNHTKQSSNRLLLAILAGIVAGILTGGAWPAAGIAVKFLGEIFIRALLMLVVPLVMTSMVVGISGLGDIRHLGGIGGRTIVYYMVTTAVSVVIGIFLVLLIQPGKAETQKERISLRGGELLTGISYRIEGHKIFLKKGKLLKSYDSRYVVILNDQNMIGGVTRTEGKSALEVREWRKSNGKIVRPQTEGTGIRIDLGIAERIKGKETSIGRVLKKVVVGLVPQNLFYSMSHNEVLPLIVFSLVFGGVLTTMGESGQSVIRLFEGLNEAIMKIVHLLMLAAPVGIGALLAGRLGQAGGFLGFLPELLRLGKYAATVMIGLAVHGMIVLPLILKIWGKQNITGYVKNVSSALLTAFSTSSSSATLPLTMKCTIDKNGISQRVSDFVLPLGATINMDGTALYEAVSALFIAQIYGVEMGPVQMLVVFLTATLAAVGAAGIPEAGLVTMVIVLKAVDLPIEGISLILVIDWFLDRCRTTVNVWGDTVGAAVVAEMEVTFLLEKRKVTQRKP